MNHRAFSLLRIKSADDERREITGIATTPETDRVGDQVMPLGMRYKIPMPLLLNHDHTQPVGLAYFQKATSDGIPFRATLPKVEESGIVQNRVNGAWHSLKYKLLGAVSVGFRVLPGGIEPLENGGLRFTQTECMELSLCTIPANPSATITGIKALDQQLHAAYAQPRTRQKSTTHRDDGAMVRALVKVVREHVQAKVYGPLATRIAALEQQQKSLRYRGVWRQTETYERNNFATYDGSLWIAVDDAPGKPGENGWQLCAKRGRDGK